MTREGALRMVDGGVRMAGGSHSPLATRQSPCAAGLTLMELMVIVVILGILVVVGIPTYRSTTQRAYWRAARDVLQVIYAGERSYYFLHAAYQDGLTKDSSPDAWRDIFMDNPNLSPDRVQYSAACNLTCKNPATFLATAQRMSGPCAGRMLTIDQNRAFGGSWPEDPDGC